MFLFSSSLAAQSVDIHGVVSDSTTGEKIPFASIVLLKTNQGASTNINGFYLIVNVAAGPYEIAASSIGYERALKKIAVLPGEPMTVNFKLVPKPVEMSEVVITDRAKRELTEINTSIHVMEQRDIRAVPVAVQEDIFRAITILPGVVSTSDVNSHFYVRGGAGDQNLILLDGMRIYNPYHAFGIFSIFDSDVVKTTEVYTGAFPPGFGGRLSSVVNMTTRDGNATSFAGRANINFISSKLQLEGPLLQDTRVIVSGRKSLFHESFGKFLRKDTPLRFYDVLVKATREEESGARYGAEGFFSGDDLVSANPEEPDYTWRNSAGAFHAAGLIQDRLYVDLVAFQNTFTAERDAKKSKTITPSTTSVNEVGARTNATFYTDSHDLYFFGFEWAFPKLDYELINSFGISRHLSSSFVEVYAWLRYQASSGPFKFDGGFHIDVGSMFQRGDGLSALQPRVNASFKFGEDWRGKISYGRFSQNIITVNNEDDVISIFDAWIKVPDNLKNERADHYVLGVEGNVFRELSTSFQAYYKYYSSLVTYNRDKVDALDPDYINSTGNSYGVETLIRYAHPFVDAYAAHTLGWTTVNNGGFEYPPHYDRRHTLNLLTVFHLVENLDVTFRWEVGSGFPFTQTIGYYDRLTLEDVFNGNWAGDTGSPYMRLGPKNAARLPAYHRLDASLVYRFTINPIKGTAGVHIVNVYDHQNIFYFDRRTGQQINMLPFFPSVTLNLEY